MVGGSFLPVSPTCRGARETESDFNRLFGSKKIVHDVTERTSLASCMQANENPD